MIPEIVDLEHKMVLNATFRLNHEAAAEIGGQDDFFHAVSTLV